MKGALRPFIFVSLALIVFSAGAVGILRYINWQESAESVDSVPWLPDAATNISYKRTNSWRIFEFDISEDEFRLWVMQYELAEITEPFYIQRYNYTGSQGVWGYKSELVDPPEFDPGTVAIIEFGLLHHHWKQNRGRVSVCFDRKANRAYFHSRDR